MNAAMMPLLDSDREQRTKVLESGLEMAVACPYWPSDSIRKQPPTGHENPVPAITYCSSSDPDQGLGWYALCVRPRYEKLAATMLANKGYEHLLPLYKCRRRRPDRYKEIQLPIFPGYLFCQFNLSARLPILTTPGILHVVGCGRIPTPIDQAEMEAIRRLAGSCLQAEPWPYLEVGQKVCVQDGPLKGTVGILLAVKNTHRLLLSVTLLQRAVAVEIDRDWVKPASVLHPRAVPLSPITLQ
jgi:transcriptional antiterminator RfaH